MGLLLGQTMGQNPTGAAQTLPVSGLVPKGYSKDNLPPNTPYSTGWFSSAGFVSLYYMIFADKQGTITLEWSEDNGATLASPAVTVAYDATFANILPRTGMFQVRSSYAKLTFTNGNIGQTVFTFTCSLFPTSGQPSLETLLDDIADTRLAMVIKGVLQGRENGTGIRKEFTGTGIGNKFPQDVNVTNQLDNGTDATGTTPLTGGTGIRGWLSSIYQRLTNGTQTTQLVNGNNQAYGSQSLPFNVAGTVAISNPGAVTDVSALAKESGGNLAAILAKLSADPATQTTLLAILNKLIANPSTEATLSSLLTKTSGDQATQTTSAAILAKLIANPATETTLASILNKITADPATQTTSAAILAKLIANPATETTLVSILNKLIANPATEATLGSILTKLSSNPATDATLTSILNKLIASPATEATLANILTQVTAFNVDQGSPSDAAATSVTGAQSEISLLKAIFNLLTGMQQRPGTGTITNPGVTVATTSAVILAANANRKGATIYAVTGSLIALAPTCSATMYTTRLSANTYYELPFGYTGPISAFGTITTFSVTELT
jgi:hypothetical protein